MTDLPVPGQAWYTAELLFLAGHGAAKLSVCLLLRRLGRDRAYLRLCTGGLVLLASWALAAILAVALQCEPAHPWALTRCRVFIVGWRAITAGDVMTEALLVGLSIRLVWGVQMRRAQKATVIGAFGTRLLIVVLVLLRQGYLDRVDIENGLRGLSAVVVATEGLLHGSLMAATVPCLKPFVIAFNTGWGQGGPKEGSYLRSGTSGGPSSQPRSHLRSADDEITMLPPEGPSQRATPGKGARGWVIHETREWSLQTEYIEMRPLQGSAEQ